MSNCPLCDLDSAPRAAGGRRRPRWAHRAWQSIRWLFPAGLLVIMPKCPVCRAAYIALATGVGVSVTAARYIQVTGLLLCVISLAYLIIRRWRIGRLSSTR